MISDSEELGVQGLFERQAAKSPDAVAVAFGEERLTYRDLDIRAGALAAHLQSLGLTADGVAGVCLGRGLEAMVGILAILKAGGAYLPLDPAYPRERLAFMLEDSGAAVLLTQEKLSHLLPENGVARVNIDLPFDKGPPLAQTPRDPANLAYVIYTSGSTGKPKGIAMPHGPLLNLLSWQQSVLPAPARTFQFAPLSFDVSFQEIFSTWASGGTLILLSEAVRRDPAGMWNLLASERAERLFLPFVALQQLADAAPDSPPDSLRDIITAGEQLRITTRIIELFERLPGCSLHNHYGPSETHVVTAFTLQGPPASWPSLPSIGKPIANTRIHLLDAELRPVPPGEPGELHVAGESLCRGYIQRPELTAARFIPNPFESPPSRLYKTGDMARLLPGGDIEFLGRADDQVKIRGVRVEPGEIETLLARHPLVGEVVVAVRDEPSGKQLAAYIKPKTASAPPRVEELRQYVRESLPEHFVPSSFSFLQSLPLTPSGKIDRKALPAPQTLPARSHPVSFESDAERQIAATWQQVIGGETPGRDDNFFDVGGDSLRVNQVHRTLSDLFGPFPVTALFEFPSIKTLAAFLTRPADPSAFAAASDRVQKQRAALARKRLSRTIA